MVVPAGGLGLLEQIRDVPGKEHPVGGCGRVGVLIASAGVVAAGEREACKERAVVFRGGGPRRAAVAA